MDTVCKVDTSGTRDCIGRFLHVKICFNVREPLMCGTFLNFPDDGRLWVDFKYEALPKYCLVCMGHATKSCRDDVNAEMAASGNSMGLDVQLLYQGLDAIMDLHGKLLRTGFRGGGAESKGGRNSPRRWRNDRTNVWDDVRRGGRVASAVGRESRVQGGGGEGRDAEENIAKFGDSPMSPRVSRASASQHRDRGCDLMEQIRCQRRADTEAMKVRDATFDGGLIGPGGVIAEGAVNVVLNSMPKEDARLNFVRVSQENGREIDLNITVQHGDEDAGDMVGMADGLEVYLYAK